MLVILPSPRRLRAFSWYWSMDWCYHCFSAGHALLSCCNNKFFGVVGAGLLGNLLVNLRLVRYYNWCSPLYCFNIYVECASKS
ncbi:hypothetical protein SOVF_196960 [Spinacia oleracea]|nr:hypothetical protein SOVF_196960 [Spinacia oleracea]